MRPSTHEASARDPRPTTRRAFLGLLASTLVVATTNSPGSERDSRMYGRIGKLMAQPGQRDALIEILLEGTTDMPGCLSYVVARDAKDEDAIWITEVWKDQESHQASLSLPSVRGAIEKGRPLIAGFGEGFETTPVGGVGLTDAPAD